MMSFNLKPFVVGVILMFVMCGISGCTFLKETFLSDISKNSCEMQDWSVVGATALENGQDLDSFNYYKVQCYKYFSIDVPDTRYNSFADGYNNQKINYCTLEKAKYVGVHCGYFNIKACQDVVPNETILDLFDSFQEGNQSCKNDIYWRGYNSAVCVCSCQ